MARPHSLRLKKEALQCETAAKLAAFLETSVSQDSYDFVLPDLLSFKCEETLLGLRGIAAWQALETEFKAVGGWISEDWDEEAEETAIYPTKEASPSKPAPKASRWTIDLIIATIAVSALLGTSLGWFYPWFSFPVLSRPEATTSDR